MAPPPLKPVAAAMGLAVVLRCVHLLAMPGTTVWRWPEVGPDLDMTFNVVWAERIREDPLGRDTVQAFTPAMQRIAPEAQWKAWRGAHVFQQAPLYAYLLALFRAPMVLYLLQVLFGAVSVAAVAWLAWKWSDDARAAIVAAFAYALAEPLVALDGLLLRDSLAISLFAFALAALEALRTRADRAGWCVGTGALLGVALLLRENFLLLALAAIALFARPRIRSAALVLAGFLLALSPLVARNLTVGAPPFSVSVLGPEAIASGLFPAEDSNPIGFNHTARLAELLSAWNGSSARALGGALGEAASHPARAGRLWGTKAWALLSPLEPSDNVGLHFLEAHSPALQVTLPIAVFFGPAAYGFWVLARRRRSPVPFVALGFLVSTLVLVPFIWRLRAGALPLLAPVAAIGLVALVQNRKPLPAVAVLAATAAIWLFPPQPLKRERLYDAYLKIQVLVKDGRWDDGLAELDRYYAGRPAGPEGPVGARIRHALHTRSPLPQP